MEWIGEGYKPVNCMPTAGTYSSALLGKVTQQSVEATSMSREGKFNKHLQHDVQ